MFNWGIMGSGFISSQFAKGIESTDTMKIGAVASVSGKNPYSICAERYYSSYEALAEAPDIDAVYVGTIHPAHLPCVKLCLEAGKPVLCEKPIAMNSRQLKEMTALARRHKVFFMEAMWSRYLPSVRYLKEALQEGEYGKVQYLHVTFGGRVSASVRRIYEAKLGGGALLDVGVYGINLADFWLGESAKEIHSWAERNEETIDLNTSVQLSYPTGAVADMMFSVNRDLPNSACIVTEQRELCIPYFWRPDTILSYAPNRDFIVEPDRLEKTFPIEGNGYQYEALEVMRCVEAGRLESPDMTWKDSLRIMNILDTIRSQSRIQYPQDSEISSERFE